MNDILNNLKKIKLNKKTAGLVIGFVCAVVLLLVSEISAFSESEDISYTDTNAYSAQYIENTEKELERVLGKIEGAGDVRVMITLQSCYENIYAKSYENEKKQTENSTNENSKEEYVIVKNGSTNEECLVIKVYEPEIKGVAVVCQGADNLKVKTAITETVCALFDISSAKVSVAKSG